MKKYIAPEAEVLSVGYNSGIAVISFNGTTEILGDKGNGSLENWGSNEGDLNY